MSMSTEFSHDDVRRILEIIDGASDLEEVDICCGELRLYIRRQGAVGRSADGSARASMPAPRLSDVTTIAKAEQIAIATSKGEKSSNLVEVCAPMLGTFYRSASPDEPAFVEVGQKVSADTTVCLIEVMKLFNSVSAGVEGTIVAIRPQNGALVEFQEVLITIAPSKDER